MLRKLSLAAAVAAAALLTPAGAYAGGRMHGSRRQLERPSRWQLERPSWRPLARRTLARSRALVWWSLVGLWRRLMLALDACWVCLDLSSLRLLTEHWGQDRRIISNKGPASIVPSAVRGMNAAKEQ